MSIHAAVIQKRVGAGSRDNERARVLLEAPGMVGPTGGIRVLIHNISISGLLMETEFDLAPGQQLNMTLPEAGDVVAKVVWRSEGLVGCSFGQPLTTAELSSIRLRYPLPTNFKSDNPGKADRSPSSLAGKLRQLRQQSGFTRAQLAYILGFSTPSIWAWETGKTVPRRSSLLAVAGVLGISMEQLEEHEGAQMILGKAGLAKFDERLLQGSIEEAKKYVAKAAGVTPSKIKISIEY